mgnify:CR=1 FL=1
MVFSECLHTLDSPLEAKGFDFPTILFIGRVFGVAKPGDENDNGST